MASDPSPALTRRQLYEAVWHEPLSKAAARLGISETMLNRTCLAAEVPVPKPTHWRKLQRGLPTSKRPLPKTKAEDELVIFVATSTPKKRERTLAESLIRAERLAENRVNVSSDVSEVHPLVKKTFKQLAKSKPDDFARHQSAESGCISVRVSPACIDRAKAITHALIKSLEARGFKRVLVEGQVRFRVLDQLLFFLLDELLDRRERPPTEEERDHRRFFYRGEPMPKYYEQYASGRLALSPSGVPRKLYARQVWSDTPTRRLEDQLNSFIAGLVHAAADVEEIYKQQAEAEKQREELNRRLNEEQRRRRAEAERRQEFERRFHAWQKGSTVHAFVEAIRAEAIRRDENISVDTDLGKWLQWATAFANDFDPVKDKPLPRYDVGSFEKTTFIVEDGFP